jgi:hypothetical protein
MRWILNIWLNLGKIFVSSKGVGQYPLVYGRCYGNLKVLAYGMLVIAEPISLGWIQLKIVPEPKKEVFF